MAVPTLFGVMVIVFFLTRVIGDPVAILLPPEASQTQLENLENALGLNRPLPYQFVRFLSSAVRGNFGLSFWQDRPAMEIVLERLPATLELALASVLVAIVVGIPAGMLAALNRNSITDLAVSVFALLGLSMPNFWLGLMLILFFGVSLRLLPISGIGGLSHLVLPALTLGASMTGILARLIRTDMLDVLSQEYMKTAYAKGLRASVAVTRHAFRNALIPTVTVIGLQFGALLGGAVVVESVFAWPGIGRLIIQAIGNRDFPVIQAAVVLFAVFFIMVNLIVDLFYGVLDPRIRYK